MNNDVRRKFRVYDTLMKKYRNGEQFALLCDGGLLKVSMFNLQMLDAKRFVVEQNTGVSDDRMSFIYDGDIVRWQGANWAVEFIRGCWYGVNGKAQLKLDDMYEDMEIVGNIHEGVKE